LSDARGKSALSSTGKAQRKLGQDVQTPRTELKHASSVADVPCMFDAMLDAPLTRPPGCPARIDDQLLRHHPGFDLG
jgi:hypothetical protein